MRFAYTRRGGPLLNWNGPSPPFQTRAGETRSLGDYYPTARNSGALRRYGGRLALPNGAAIPYEHNRQLGAWGASVGYGGTRYHPAPKGALGSLDIPRPGAPEIVSDYEAPQPGAAIIHLGHACTWDEAHRRAHTMSGYMPEGAARTYGQTMLSADEAKPSTSVLSSPAIRRVAALAAAYHGVKRNHGSILWGLVWGLATFVAPVNGLIVPAFGFAQGFGKPK